MDAYYCACHEWNDSTPKEPEPYIDPETCMLNNCKDGVDPNASDNLRDTGWHRVIWGAYNDAYNFSPTNFAWCAAANNDSDGANNDCLLPLANRLFRRPYHDPGHLIEMGVLEGDWDDYWNATGKNRTRFFHWDWRKADYPHIDVAPGWIPYMGKASVRLWVRHANQAYPHPLPHNFTKVLNVGSFGKVQIDAFRLVYPWERLCALNPRRLLGPFDLQSNVGPLVLQAIDIARPVPSELEPYVWHPVPEDAAIKGLLVKRFNHKTGDFSVSASEIASGVAPFTKGFAATRWDESDEIFIFGGSTHHGDLPPLLWHGAPHQVGDATVFYWDVVEGQQPGGRTGAILVSDVARNRLLLMYGLTSERQSSTDVFAFDRASGTWSSVAADVANLAPLDSAGYTHDNERLFVYGGQRNGEAREGLYVINLNGLSGERVDAELAGPGARMGSALHYDAASDVLYLFGGSGSSQVYNDLWRFDMKRRTWSQVTDGTEPGAPPPMFGASLIVSPIDGAASVLAGSREQGPGEPMWQLWAGGWKTAGDLQVQKPD